VAGVSKINSERYLVVSVVLSFTYTLLKTIHRPRGYFEAGLSLKFYAEVRPHSKKSEKELCVTEPFPFLKQGAGTGTTEVRAGSSRPKSAKRFESNVRRTSGKAYYAGYD